MEVNELKLPKDVGAVRNSIRARKDSIKFVKDDVIRKRAKMYKDKKLGIKPTKSQKADIKSSDQIAFDLKSSAKKDLRKEFPKPKDNTKRNVAIGTGAGIAATAAGVLALKNRKKKVQENTVNEIRDYIEEKCMELEESYHKIPDRHSEIAQAIKEHGFYLSPAETTQIMGKKYYRVIKSHSTKGGWATGYDMPVHAHVPADAKINTLQGTIKPK
jgi:hypothetical protein